jgi:hypothetical protein
MGLQEEERDRRLRTKTTALGCGKRSHFSSQVFRNLFNLTAPNSRAALG